MTYYIAVEGIDGSGKQTMAENLRKSLTTRLGATCEVVSFPRYGTPLVDEEIIPRLLRPEPGRELGLAESLSNAALFSLDRNQWYADHLAQGSSAPDIVIFDRWIASNIAYQSAIHSQPATGEFADKLRGHEQGPEPDLTILLDVDPDTALSRRRKRQSADEDDKYEADRGLQARVHCAYQSLMAHSAHRSWITTDDHERAFQEVWERTANFLG